MPLPGYSHVLTKNTHFEVVQGDITAVPCDAVVNAANSHLKHIGGLAAALVAAGGEIIQQESDRWVVQHGPISFDRCAVTSAGSLPCRWIIHAVGPQWGEGDEQEKLARTFLAALRTAESLGTIHLVIPPISTGIFGVPKLIAAYALSQSVRQFFQNSDTSIRRLTLIAIDAGTYQFFTEHFQTNGI